MFRSIPLAHTAATDQRKVPQSKINPMQNLAMALAACGVLFLNACPNPQPPPPPTATLTEFQPNIGRGGRSVAISVYTGDYTKVAIAAAENGGLFLTNDGGQAWSHVDSLPAFRMSDVAFVPTVFTNPHIVIATAFRDSNPDPQANQGGIWASSDGGTTWTHVVLPGSCSSSPTSGTALRMALSTMFTSRPTVGSW